VLQSQLRFLWIF